MYSTVQYSTFHLMLGLQRGEGGAIIDYIRMMIHIPVYIGTMYSSILY